MFIRSTPKPVAFADELALEVWEYAYRSSSNEEQRIVTVVSVTNKGNLISCFSLQNCMKHYIY
jgi:hypothetical protein